MVQSALKPYVGSNPSTFSFSKVNIYVNLMICQIIPYSGPTVTEIRYCLYCYTLRHLILIITRKYFIKLTYHCQIYCKLNNEIQTNHLVLALKIKNFTKVLSLLCILIVWLLTWLH